MKFYTLEEAEEIRLIREHRVDGHEWIGLTAGNKVIALYCKCGAEAAVVEAKEPEGREI